MNYNEGDHVSVIITKYNGNKRTVLGTVIGIGYKEKDPVRYFVDITQRGERQTIVEAAPEELKKITGGRK